MFRNCGLNAECSVRNHKKLCACPQDFTGNYVYYVYYSSTNYLSIYLKPISFNLTFIQPYRSPVHLSTGFRFTKRTVSRELVISVNSVSIYLSLLGNPNVECVRIPSTCYATTDCPDSMACTEGICMPQCQVTMCTMSTICTVCTVCTVCTML